MKKANNTFLNHISIRILFSFLVLISFFLFVKIFDTYAATVTTSVTVGNAAPAFSAGPAENPASTTTTPTDVGTNVTFTATANDNSGESYYLIVCSTNAAEATESGEPTCTATEYCTSTLTTDEVATSCTYAVTTGDTLESYAWYAFVCDANATNARCSAGSQGTGDSGSPFAVNHPPTFTNLTGDADDRDPGEAYTWTGTSSDADDDGAQDQVKLLICKTTGISAGACDGGGSDTWCSSSLVNSAPTCDYSIPAVAPDGTFDAWAYIVDSHNLASTGTYQGSGDVDLIINNVAPSLSSVNINGGSAINLNENSTKTVDLTAVITDNNSCYGTEFTTILGYAYRSDITYANCNDDTDDDNDYCYADISCTLDSAVDDCTSATDGSAAYKCTVSFQYHADPTDTATLYDLQNWLTTIKVIDDDTASDADEVSPGVEMNSLTAASISSTLPYGDVEVGETVDPLSIETTTTATGNVGLDQEYSGAANMCVNYPTCTGGTPIGVAYQKYALASSTAYASGYTLSVTATERELNVLKPDTDDTTPDKFSYWGIQIPSGTDQGAYTGANTLTAIKGETAGW